MKGTESSLSHHATWTRYAISPITLMHISRNFVTCSQSRNRMCPYILSSLWNGVISL